MIRELIGKLLCAVGKHKWHKHDDTEEITDYDKWSRIYSYKAQAHCDRNCGVPVTTVYWSK